MKTKKILLPILTLLLTNFVLAFDRGGGMMGGGDDMEFRRSNMGGNDGGRTFGERSWQQGGNPQGYQTSNSRTIDTPDDDYKVNNTVNHQSLTKEQVNTTVTNQNTGHSYSAQTQYNHVGNYGNVDSTVTNNKNGHSYTVNASHSLNGSTQSTVTNNQTGKTYTGSQVANQVENNHQQSTTTYYSSPSYATTYYGGGYYYEPYPVYYGVGVPMGYAGTTNVTNNYYNSSQQQIANSKESSNTQESSIGGYYYY